MGYYPIALLSVGGIVLALTGSVLLILVTAQRRRYQALRQLIGPCALALFIALAVLAITATFRWTNSGFLA